MNLLVANIASIIFACIACLMIFKGLPHWGWFILLSILSLHVNSSVKTKDKTDETN